ncbi:hypothetical protein MMC16_003917 [Acarospora aff. strigata]|nr:hypothetical protein [Acarospora aff. strigata]
MGQSASSQREEFLRRDSRRFSQLVQSRNAQSGRANIPDVPTHHVFTEPTLVRTSSHGSLLESQPPFATFRRQVSAQSVPVQADDGTNGEVQRGDEVLFEQEERPLVNMEELGMRDAPITHITASPMPRRPSVLSRLSSRLLPRYATSTSGSSGVDPHGSDRALRRRLSDRLEPASEEGGTQPNTNRFSTIGSIRSRYGSSPRQRRRRELPPVISPPLPMSTDGAISPDGFSSSSLRGLNPVEPMTSATGPSTSGNSLPFLRRSSRFSRVRNSLSMPLPRLFSQPSVQGSEAQSPQTPPRRPSRVAFAEGSDHLLPPLSMTGPSLDVDEPSLESSWFSATPRADQSRSPISLAHPPNAPRRRSRSINNILRGETSRLVRREDQAPLSRVLQFAAAAIAAQLSGTPAQAITNMQAVGSDGLDGSLDNFFQTLQNATSLGGPEAGSEGSNNAAQTEGSLPPVNFLRVFRFVNSNEQSRQTSGTSTPNVGRAQQGEVGEGPEGSTTDGEEGSDGRTVTLVVVGVRSVPASGGNGGEGLGAGGPSLDALLNLPIVPSTNLLRAGAGGLLRRADGRSRFSHRRRASMGGVNTFPANYDSQRHQRMHGSSRSQSGDATPVAGSSLPTVLSESPPGPHPPPSTPADPSMSAYSSGTTTPNRRPSSASAMSPPGAPARRESFVRRSIGAGLEPPAEDAASQTARQRRRSDSEFARHRDLGSGAARRNGVVGPNDDAPAHGGRSWLIYVVGTNLSEDHPAFATPSLFTDSPTYEDMLLLSSLLGPAKPPVASDEDVASAPGVYRVQGTSDALVAQDINGLVSIPIGPTERCLVCLCDYELKEEVRQLSKCGHLYHRECIDEWLTTGRNSCPLCRGQGVDEKAEARVEPSSNSTPQAL